MPKIIRRFIAGVLLGTQVSCYGPTRQYQPLTDFEGRRPGAVHVALNDGQVIELSSPRVVGDSALAGWNVATRQSVELPLRSVKTVTGRERSTGRTALLGTAIMATIAVGAVFVSRRATMEPADIDSMMGSP